MNNITGYSNTIRVLMDVGCSERGARMAADLLMAKKDIVDRCEKLEEENRELRDFLYNLSNMIRGGDEDYACREITQWHKEQGDD